MGFAELRALTQAANQKVEEGQQQVGAVNTALEETISVLNSAISDIREKVAAAKETYEEARNQYAAISDNDAVQAAAAAVSNGAERLDELVLIAEEALDALEGSMNAGREKGDDATNSGSQAIEQGERYLSGLPG